MAILMASSDTIRSRVSKRLRRADIRINGRRNWDIQVHNTKTYTKVFSEGLLGLGEAYMDGWWEAQRLDEFVYRALCQRIDMPFRFDSGKFSDLYQRLSNRQTEKLAVKNREFHYNLGNRLYESMLGPSMVYSCGYWRSADTLEQAQQDKNELIAQKLFLKPGMTVLDIGCGWGATAKYLAEQYGVRVTGITTSSAQALYARETCQGLPVTIQLKGYRQVEGKYDRVLSVGMFEHVGYKNYPEFMSVVSRSLRAEGLFLLHTIGRNMSGYVGDPWIRRYIFPNAMTPSAAQVCGVCEESFVIEDLHNFGADYDATLMAWFYNFDKNWHQLRDIYDERFYRMWKYYLLSCAALFRARRLQLWQFVLSARGVQGGYIRPE